MVVGLIGAWLLFVRDPDNHDVTTFGGLLLILGFVLFVISVAGLLAVLVRITRT